MVTNVLFFCFHTYVIYDCVHVHFFCVYSVDGGVKSLSRVCVFALWISMEIFILANCVSCEFITGWIFLFRLYRIERNCIKIALSLSTYVCVYLLRFNGLPIDMCVSAQHISWVYLQNIHSHALTGRNACRTNERTKLQRESRMNSSETKYNLSFVYTFREKSVLAGSFFFSLSLSLSLTLDVWFNVLFKQMLIWWHFMYSSCNNKQYQPNPIHFACVSVRLFTYGFAVELLFMCECSCSYNAPFGQIRDGVNWSPNVNGQTRCGGEKKNAIGNTQQVLQNACSFVILSASRKNNQFRYFLKISHWLILHTELNQRTSQVCLGVCACACIWYISSTKHWTVA